MSLIIEGVEAGRKIRMYLLCNRCDALYEITGAECSLPVGWTKYNIGSNSMHSCAECFADLKERRLKK